MYSRTSVKNRFVISQSECDHFHTLATENRHPVHVSLCFCFLSPQSYIPCVLCHINETVPRLCFDARCQQGSSLVCLAATFITSCVADPYPQGPCCQQCWTHWGNGVKTQEAQRGVGVHQSVATFVERLSSGPGEHGLGKSHLGSW